MAAVARPGLCPKSIRHVSPQGICQLVANLLATRQTILTCQDVANKSATSLLCRCNVVVEFGKRHDTTDNGLLPASTCYGLATRKHGVMDFGSIGLGG